MKLNSYYLASFIAGAGLLGRLFTPQENKFQLTSVCPEVTTTVSGKFTDTNGNTWYAKRSQGGISSKNEQILTSVGVPHLKGCAPAIPVSDAGWLTSMRITPYIEGPKKQHYGDAFDFATHKTQDSLLEEFIRENKLPLLKAAILGVGDVSGLNIGKDPLGVIRLVDTDGLSFPYIFNANKFKINMLTEETTKPLLEWINSQAFKTLFENRIDYFKTACAESHQIVKQFQQRAESLRDSLHSLSLKTGTVFREESKNIMSKFREDDLGNIKIKRNRLMHERFPQGSADPVTKQVKPGDCESNLLK